MYYNLIFVLFIGLISSHVSAKDNNETTETPKTSEVAIDEKNATLSQNNSNSSINEFFGINDGNVSSVNGVLLQKPNISSKVIYKEKQKNPKYRIRNYNQDPLQSNEQSQNPILSGSPGSRGSRRQGGGAVDPQLNLLLQNNPRLRLLAEQNPEIAQQIFRNPRLLRDPRIANAIRSQLGDGGGGGLLSFLPGGLGAALNPLGIGLGGGGQRRPFNGGQNEGEGNDGGLFGAPRGVNRRQPFNRNRNNEENIGGGYYGNNKNYANNQNNPNNEQNVNNEDNTPNTDQNEGNTDAEGQDYDNSGQEGTEDGQQGGEEGGDESQEAQDPSQDPANDPDIQQLQNLGGGVGDNFPEGLFPPGLLSKEDLEEIRKQQEKQAREQAEKEKQQQGGGDKQGANEGQDYDYGNGNSDEGNGGEENQEEDGQGVEENTTVSEEPSVETTPVPPPVYRSNPNRNLKYNPEFGGVRQGSVNNPGVEYDEILDVNTPVVTPPSLNSIKSKGKSRGNAIPPAIPVPGVQYKGQQPIQPYINSQPVSGLYQPYPGQQQYQQPIQYYPQYQPQYVPQQQFIPQNYPQQFVPQQQYAGQQPGQYLQQPIYQPIPVQTPAYLPQQPIYNQYLNNRGKQIPYNRNQINGGLQTPDPNIANHNLNTIPDDSEDSDGYEDQSVSPNNGGFSGHNGRSFQQQPRIFSSSAQNTESSVQFNTTEPTVVSNKFNTNT